MQMILLKLTIPYDINIIVSSHNQFIEPGSPQPKILSLKSISNLARSLAEEHRAMLRPQLSQ